MDAGISHSVGKILIGAGLLLCVAGLAVLAAGKIGLPLGRLPGDISIRGKQFSFYAPIATCLLLSIGVSLIFWLIGMLRR